MNELTDIQIKAWIKSGERFEQRGDGDGLFFKLSAIASPANVES